MRHLHLIVLQHGYHGSAEDLQHLEGLLTSAASFSAEALPSVQSPDAKWSVASTASPLPSSPLRQTSGTLPTGAAASAGSSTTSCPYTSAHSLRLETVILNVRENHARKTDNGVLKCSERLVGAVMARVREQLQLDSAHTTNGTSPANELVQLHLSFVAHSMGGLMVRAALPVLEEQLQALVASDECDNLGATATPDRPLAGVVWETFCCVSVPHLGVTHMPSPMRAAMGKLTGWLLSRGLHDLFLSSPVILNELTTPAHLQGWARFHRRVLLSTANDRTVMSYSSVFCISPEEQAILFAQHKGAEPSGTVAQLPPPATDLDELRHSGWLLDGVTESSWPPALLPREREAAKQIVAQVGPFEVHTVDFRPRYAALVADTALPLSSATAGITAGTTGTVLPEVVAQPARASSLMAIARRGAQDWSHRAVVCKGEYATLPGLFGFVGEFIASDILGAVAGAAVPTEQTTSSTAHAASQSVA